MMAYNYRTLFTQILITRLKILGILDQELNTRLHVFMHPCLFIAMSLSLLEHFFNKTKADEKRLVKEIMNLGSEEGNFFLKALEISRSKY